MSANPRAKSKTKSDGVSHKTLNMAQLPLTNVVLMDVVTIMWTDALLVASSYQKGIELIYGNKEVPCYYPFVEALDEIFEAYPKSTMLVVVMDKELAEWDPGVS